VRGAESLQRINVRPRWELAGADAVPDAMPREEGHADALQRAYHEAVAGPPIRRIYCDLCGAFQAGDMVEPAAADDPHLDRPAGQVRSAACLNHNALRSPDLRVCAVLLPGCAGGPTIGHTAWRRQYVCCAGHPWRHRRGLACRGSGWYNSIELGMTGFDREGWSATAGRGASPS